MALELETTFRELGLAQYLDSFVDQGFDTWETILDIQESDLDAMGVKLGHRRKLQRRIANARGIAPSISLASPKSIVEGGKRDGTRPGQGREASGDGTGVVKRKYRRHPKPDENAPERSPSAYVLFSNKMREDLKGHNLTFTEIAKLVGENWQSLPPAEKEAYERQANAAKEKYHRDLMEYKKTPEYRKYAQYLQEFKEKQAKQNQDPNRRAKVEPSRLRHGSTSSSAATGGSNSVGSGSASALGSRSSSERMQGSEPPPNRHERVDSIGSIAESHRSLAGDVPMPHPMDNSRISPRAAGFNLNGTRDAAIVGGERQSLPSLSDMLDDSRAPNPVDSAHDGSPYTMSGYVPADSRSSMSDRGHHISSAVRAPLLHHHGSPTASTVSTSPTPSTANFGRPPADVVLPIHALLSNREAPGPPQSPRDQGSSPTFAPAPAPMDRRELSQDSARGPRGYGFQSAPSALQHMKIENFSGGDVIMTSPGMSASPAPPKADSRPGLDGMSALLRAGEIVDRRNVE